MSSETEKVRRGLLRAKRPKDRRLAFIDFRLAFAGSLKRPLLTDEFGISAQQATKDIKAYAEIAEGNLDYSLAQKAYLPSDTFKPAFASTTAKTFLRRLERVASGSSRFKNWVGADVPVKFSRISKRLTDESVLQAVVTGLRHKRCVEIDYVSIKSGSRSTRVILPTALGSDGFRWHVRARDCEKKQYSDFVLSRISKATLGSAMDEELPRDAAWHTLCHVDLVPSKHLPEASREVVAREFGMTEGVMRVETTEAMLFYTLRGYGFDPRKYKDDRLVNESLFSIEIDNLDEIQSSLARRD